MWDAMNAGGATSASSWSDSIGATVDEAASYVSLALDAAAVLLVAAGALITAIRMLQLAAGRLAGALPVRHVLIEFGRWLVAALTFQLGSDIVNTTVAPTWDELGRLAAIAGIRTFLTYFLDRDLERARAGQQGEGEAAPAVAVPKAKA